MKLSHILTVFCVIIGLIVLFGSYYTVSEQEQVVITAFGQPRGEPVKEAGLHFKTPYIEDVNRFEKRVLQWDGPTSEIPTKDKLIVVVDTFARWRITDPLLYFTRLRDERTAQSRLDSLIGSEVRNVVAKHNLIEVVRTNKNRKPTPDESLIGEKAIELPAIQFGREQLEADILAAARSTLAARKDDSLGIELLDFRFKRINYKPGVIEKIYTRMISERDQIAQRFLSEGAGEAAKISGTRERDLREIESNAYKQVQEIQGKADAEATEIYAKAYNTSPAAGEFYQFLKTMETYKATLGRDTTLILTTDSDLFKFFKHIDGGKARASLIKPAPPVPAVPPQQ